MSCLLLYNMLTLKSSVMVHNDSKVLKRKKKKSLKAGDGNVCREKRTLLNT